jgi:hypothetical protein
VEYAENMSSVMSLLCSLLFGSTHIIKVNMDSSFIVHMYGSYILQRRVFLVAAYHHNCTIDHMIACTKCNILNK